MRLVKYKLQMNKPSLAKKIEKAFVRLGRELSAATKAESAANIIAEIASELIGWDACYLVLYDPAQGGKPRPLLIMDLLDGVRTLIHSPGPEKLTLNMERAINEDGFLLLHNAPIEVENSYSFGGSRRTVSHLFVPLRSGERTIGVFSIQSYTLNAYNEQSLETFKSLANQCAGALERIWAQEALTEIEARRALLYNASHSISASLELEQLYEIIYQTVLQVMPCDDFVISAYDETRNEIVPLYAIEKKSRLVVEPYYADRGLTTSVIRSGKPYLLNSITEMNDSGIDFVFFTQTEDATQSIIAVPMILYGKSTGMISAQSYHSNAYTKDDQDLLELLAAHAAVAIENARLFAKIQHLADVDALTGIYNRRKFYEAADREFARARRYEEALSAILLDVDDFKKFNDRFGHRAGDFVLQIVIEECKACIRDVDILARHGGEEFVILLTKVDLKNALIVAERLRVRVEHADLEAAKKFLEQAAVSGAENETLRVSVSVGVAELDESCANIDILVDHADRAMYAAKNKGRNTVVAWNDVEKI